MQLGIHLGKNIDIASCWRTLADVDLAGSVQIIQAGGHHDPTARSHITASSGKGGCRPIRHVEPLLRSLPDAARTPRVEECYADMGVAAHHPAVRYCRFPRVYADGVAV